MIVWRNPVIKHMDEFSQSMAYMKASHQFRLGFVATCILEKEKDCFSDFFWRGFSWTCARSRICSKACLLCEPETSVFPASLLWLTVMLYRAFNSQHLSSFSLCDSWKRSSFLRRDNTLQTDCCKNYF